MAQLLPEAQAGEEIDALLSAAGWAVQDYRYNPSVLARLPCARFRSNVAGATTSCS